MQNYPKIAIKITALHRKPLSAGELELHFAQGRNIVCVVTGAAACVVGSALCCQFSSALCCQVSSALCCQ